MRHEPVMVTEVLEHLEPGRGGVFVDCTIGLGGHSKALLESGATRVLGLDRDPAALAVAAEVLSGYGERVELAHRDYRDLEAELDGRGLGAVDGVLADLGVSSLQLEGPGRGFSFRRDEPLDMRMDPTRGATAAESIRTVEEKTLADVIYRFGEERYARRVARAIVGARDKGGIESTGALAEVVRRAIPRRGFSRIDPATRTFQALRIWVNGELDGLDRFLAVAAGRLASAGRLVVITFHSLEDRVVKHTLRELAADNTLGLTIRTKRPIRPGAEEIERNPRARSAKLRAAERNGRAR